MAKTNKKCKTCGKKLGVDVKPGRVTVSCVNTKCIDFGAEVKNFN